MRNENDIKVSEQSQNYYMCARVPLVSMSPLQSLYIKVLFGLLICPKQVRVSCLSIFHQSNKYNGNRLVFITFYLFIYFLSILKKIDHNSSYDVWHLIEELKIICIVMMYSTLTFFLFYLLLLFTFYFLFIFLWKNWRMKIKLNILERTLDINYNEVVFILCAC